MRDGLVAEPGADASPGTVERFVKYEKSRRARASEQHLDPTRAPGEARADFGERDFYLRGVRTRPSCLVTTSPFSNVGLAQVFPGENAECVRQALRNAFVCLGGAPLKMAFDNAAGVGRKACDAVRTTELFERCSAHYGFRGGGNPRGAAHGGALLARQMGVRAANHLARRMKRAKFPAVKSLEGYDFPQAGFPEGCGEADLRSLAFVDVGQGFVFHGKAGRGKTHLAIGVGIAVASAGKSVGFFAVARLVTRLASARDRGPLKRGLDDLASADLLMLDELGCVPLDVNGARPLFQAMSAASESQSMTVATNIEFSKWGTVFGGDKMASAVVDRLVYTGRLVEFNGKSYRTENALMLGKGRGRR